MGRHVHAGTDQTERRGGWGVPLARAAGWFASGRYEIRCAHCDLPVWLGGDPAHPGHGMIEYRNQRATLREDDLPDLHLVHRFCYHSLLAQSRNAEPHAGRVSARASLGWATECYEAGMPMRRHDSLGLDTAWSSPSAAPGSATSSEALYRKRWTVRQMRCATLAYRYYWCGHRRRRPTIR